MFATAIHADIPFGDLHEHLRRALADSNLGLAGDGFVTNADGKGAWARYAIVPPDEYADRPWHHPAHPCPFVGPLAGYLRWETWEDPYQLRSIGLPLSLLHEGRGVTARLTDGRTVAAVALRSWDLDQIFGKYGFNDGDELLTRDDGPYQDHVLGAIERALKAAGLSAPVSWMATGHNPVRLGWYQPAGSTEMVPALWDETGPEPRLVDPDRALAGLSVDVWTYDFRSLRDDTFWSAP